MTGIVARPSLGQKLMRTTPLVTRTVELILRVPASDRRWK